LKVGGSLTGLIVMVTVPVEVPPLPSSAWNVKLSLPL